ncbi:HupE/UreJ family protein [Aliikangiella coralliicola]|uniref:HupE/UreJ family protein n=1 Tax=Aliikangiella coralliicola TaxID=2592383 RepID=A0A545UGH6_9GAMM|nr:HupE/UreJ family protein [Aliikangiella coralliicola]TQV88568.1 HupE/UreJ family protein [Aliikangiella coralliicola]
MILNKINNYLLPVSVPSLIAVLFFCFFSTQALAHPEDEFCNDVKMDPQLCAQLAELDRPAKTDGNFDLPEIKLDRSPFETALLYTKLGVEHILPMGLDHLAFVLALLLSSTAFRPLLIQISLFTLAHSVTLILGVLGILVLEGTWVEVAIAFSIVFVAIENIFLKSLTYWRPLIVFCFGLLHGLGFAGALSELGVPEDHFVSALLGFNLGVEIGQLSFALIVFLMLYKSIKKDWYKHFVVIPGSLMIACLGSYWVIERII